MEKKHEAYKTIGEVAKILGLINKKKGTLSTHTIRFWETKFRQIKPKILAGKRRYYSNKEIRIIKLIKYLLKERGMTIKGVKTLLNNPLLSRLPLLTQIKTVPPAKQRLSLMLPSVFESFSTKL